MGAIPLDAPAGGAMSDHLADMKRSEAKLHDAMVRFEWAMQCGGVGPIGLIFAPFVWAIGAGMGWMLRKAIEAKERRNG